MKRSLITALCLASALPSAFAQSVPDGKPYLLRLSAHHATVGVSDINKEAEWYVRVLGFHEEARRQGPDFDVRHLAIPGFRIDLVWQKATAGMTHTQRPDGPGLAGLVGLGWLHLVFTTPVLDATLQHLTAEKANLRAERDTDSALLRVIVHDPEGNEIEIDPEG